MQRPLDPTAKALERKSSAHEKNLTQAPQEGLPVKPGNMAFISVRTNEEPPQERVGAMIPCRLEAPLTNAKDGSNIIDSRRRYRQYRGVIWKNFDRGRHEST
jgi:hypothetical protein